MVCSQPLVVKALELVKVERPEDLSAIEAVLCRLMDSKLGRELSSEWIADGSTITVLYAAIADTKIIKTKAGPRVWGTSGLSDIGKARITINKLFLQAHHLDETIIFAHEVFGHMLAEKAAYRAGCGYMYAKHCVENETYANLVGWIISFRPVRLKFRGNPS